MTMTASAIILAGGDGTRLRALTRALAGDDRPKQFCRILGGRTLLDQTRHRVARTMSPQRTLIVLNRAHEGYYTPLLADVPLHSLVVQPSNRGTAPAIVYALLRLATVAPPGPVAIFPSDHYVSDDEVFMGHVRHAVEAVMTRPELIVLLGIAADRPETEYGWIEPARRLVGSRSRPIYRVRRFWEKPAHDVARRLQAEGCLWNSFVLVAEPATLLAVIREAAPAIMAAFAPVRSRLATAWEDGAIRAVYASLAASDLSRHVLQTVPDRLSVLPVTGVEWNDLGDPGRVRATEAALGWHQARATA